MYSVKENQMSKYLIISIFALFSSGVAYCGGGIGGTPPAITDEVMVSKATVIDSESPFVIFDREKSSLIINPKLTEVEISLDEWKSAMASVVADETVAIRIKGIGFSEVTIESIDVVNKRLYGKLENGERVFVKPKVTISVLSSLD